MITLVHYAIGERHGAHALDTNAAPAAVARLGRREDEVGPLAVGKLARRAIGELRVRGVGLASPCPVVACGAEGVPAAIAAVKLHVEERVERTAAVAPQEGILHGSGKLCRCEQVISIPAVGRCIAPIRGAEKVWARVLAQWESGIVVVAPKSDELSTIAIAGAGAT